MKPKAVVSTSQLTADLHDSFAAMAKVWRAYRAFSQSRRVSWVSDCLTMLLLYCTPPLVVIVRFTDWIRPAKTLMASWQSRTLSRGGRRQH